MTSALQNVSSSRSRTSNISHKSINPCEGQVTSSDLEIGNSSRCASYQTTTQASSCKKTNQKKKILGIHRSKFVDDHVDEMLDENLTTDTGVIRYHSNRRGQTSITHLMKFSLPPLPHDYRNTLARESWGRKSYGIRSGHLLSDKARYIHANYRFIVKPNKDYKLQAVDADQPLDWNDILQILVSSVSQGSSCPICLSRPIVPRMAKCGHIICLPCLIRYMDSECENDSVLRKKSRWKKCPICWDSVIISEVKPVRWFTGQENSSLQEGEDVVLRLVIRHPRSTLALPRDEAQDEAQAQGKSEDIPWYSPDAAVADYARIMKGSEEYMVERFRTEANDLICLENEDKLIYGETPEWTRKALSEVNEAKEKIIGIGNPPKIVRRPDESKYKRLPNQVFDDKIYHEAFPFENNMKSCQDGAEELKPQGKEPYGPKEQVDVKNKQQNIEKQFFFYQALPHYYLSPLDIRILKSAYGSFDSFPATIIPQIESISTGHIMDNDLRRRIKYLSHIPQGCEIKFLECNWTSVISSETLSNFTNEIENRRKKNYEKEFREEQNRLLAERAEDDAQWAAARRQSSIESEYLPEKSFQGWEKSSDPSNTSGGPQMSSAYSQLPNTSKSSRTVWGTALVAPVSPEIPTLQPQLEEDDGWLHTWETELETQDIMTAKAKNLLQNRESSKTEPVSGTGKIKRKAKKITLMSTTGRRAA